MINEMTVEEKLMDWCDKNGCVFIRVAKSGDRFVAVDIEKKRTNIGYDFTLFDIDYVLNGGND